MVLMDWIGKLEGTFQACVTGSAFARADETIIEGKRGKAAIIIVTATAASTTFNLDLFLALMGAFQRA